MQWDVKSADMKYLATMAKNEGVPLTQKRKRNNKQSVLWGKCFRCCLGFNNEIIIDLYVTDLNLFDWLFNHAFQRELYVELRCYYRVIDWLTGKCVALQFNAYGKWALRLYDGSDLKTYLLMRWLGPDALAVCRAHRGLPVGFLLLQYSV